MADDIIRALVEGGFLTADQLDEAKERLAEWDNEPFEPLPPAWYLDSAGYRLQLVERGETLRVLELGQPATPFRPDDLSHWAQPLVALFDTASGQKIGELPLGGVQGLAMGETAKLLVEDVQEFTELPVTPFMVNRGTLPRGTMGFPLDVMVAHDRLLVTDRGAGLLFWTDRGASKVAGRVQIRPPGSNNSLHVAVPTPDRAFVTDNQTSLLIEVALETGEVHKHSPGLGVLGNLMATGEHLYVLTVKPAFGLKRLDLATLTADKAIPLKGEALSDVDDPRDLMAISPDSRLLLVMTYMNEPEPYTPVINVIELATAKNIHRFRIPLAKKPAVLAFQAPNPHFHPRRTLDEALIDRGFFTPASLANAKRALEERAQGLEGEVVGTSILDLPEAMEAPPLADELSEAGAERTEHVNISPAVEPIILEMAREQFLQDTDLDLRGLPEALDRIKTAVAKLRRELEWYTRSVLKVSFLVDDHSLGMPFSREEVLELAHRHERDTMLQGAKLKTLPQFCPNCNKHLFGSYMCRACGYQLDVPELGGKKSLILASYHPLGNLSDGHLLIPDSDNKRILEIDHERQICWQLGGNLTKEGDLELQAPYDALRLPNGNTLFVDNLAHRVAEVTPRGRLFWQIPVSERHPELRLYRPVKATRLPSGNTIVVDKGHHRVFEITRDLKIVWQYGHMENAGVTPGHLRHPNDVQRLPNGNTLIVDAGNHRVIELDGDQIVWQFGNPENRDEGGMGNESWQLAFPKSAWRMDNGNTLIVDSGNRRILEVEPDGAIIWRHECDDDDLDLRIEEPLRAYRLGSGNTLLFGRHLLLEIDKDHAPVWNCPLIQLESRREVEEQAQKRTFKLRKGLPYMRQSDDEPVARPAAPAAPAKAETEEDRQARLARLAQLAASRFQTRRGQTDQLVDLVVPLCYRQRNLVYLIDRQRRQVWKFGGDGIIDRPQMSQMIGDVGVLICDTNRHRVIEVDRVTREVVWQFGKTDSTDVLGHPRCALRLTSGNTLICDQQGAQVIEVSPDGDVVWRAGGWEKLNTPYWAERLDSGHTLVTDWSDHRVVELDPQGEEVWAYGQAKQGGSGEGQLHFPEMAKRLENGNTLIVDTRNNRVMEVHPEGGVVWSYMGQTLNKLHGPSWADRLPDGHTVVIHGGNRQILEINPGGEVVWKYFLPADAS